MSSAQNISRTWCPKFKEKALHMSPNISKSTCTKSENPKHGTCPPSDCRSTSASLQAPKTKNMLSIRRITSFKKLPSTQHGIGSPPVAQHQQALSPQYTEQALHLSFNIRKTSLHSIHRTGLSPNNSKLSLSLHSKLSLSLNVSKPPCNQYTELAFPLSPNFMLQMSMHPFSGSNASIAQHHAESIRALKHRTGPASFAQHHTANLRIPIHSSGPLSVA